MIPTVSLAAYEAARRGAGLIDRSDRGRVVVSGQDRAAYLHGLLTNDIAALASGQGCYAAYLTPQGRMIADLFVYELGDLILVTMSGNVTATVLARLDQFIFSEDVQLGDVTGTFAQYAIVGPGAADVVAQALDSVSAEKLSALGEHANMRASAGGHPVIVARVTDTGEPGFDLFVEQEQAVALRTTLEQAGAVPIDAATAETLRIESGVPLFHRDMDEDTIPLEAGIEGRAISLTKGCYVGQEVIIRVLHRGHGRVARKLVGLVVDGGPPVRAGATVRSAGRDIGRVTSATISPALDRSIALAYVHRDFVQPGTPVVVDEVDTVAKVETVEKVENVELVENVEHRPAVVTALPFVSNSGGAVQEP